MKPDYAADLIQVCICYGEVEFKISVITAFFIIKV